MSIDIDAIEARENAATPGPWYSDNSDNMDDAGNHYSVMYGDGWYLARVWKDMKQSNCVADAAFIAAARQDVPALCAEVRELRAALERARALLAELEWCGVDNWLECPWCLGTKAEHYGEPAGHKPDCKLAALLAAASGGAAVTTHLLERGRALCGKGTPGA